jgi:DNA end-binding protein Ku
MKGANISAAEMKMATQLVDDMTEKWNPDDFKDEFKHEIMKLVDKKVKAGKTETVIEPQEEAPSSGDNVIDLTELLARSLKGNRGNSKIADNAGKGRSKSSGDDDTVGAKSSSAESKSGSKTSAAPTKTARTSRAKSSPAKAAAHKTPAKTPRARKAA